MNDLLPDVWARQSEILKQIVKEGMTLALIGGGIAAAGGAALVACGVAAFRAACIDTAKAVRYD